MPRNGPYDALPAVSRSGVGGNATGGKLDALRAIFEHFPKIQAIRNSPSPFRHTYTNLSKQNESI